MTKVMALVFVATLFSGCVVECIEPVCATPATVRDLTGLDGCGFVFELEDGTRLEPVRPARGWCGTPPLPKEVTEDPLFNFQFVDGKKVFIEYESAEGASICMAGELVKITCITEATSSVEE